MLLDNLTGTAPDIKNLQEQSMIFLCLQYPRLLHMTTKQKKLLIWKRISLSTCRNQIHQSVNKEI